VQKITDYRIENLSSIFDSQADKSDDARHQILEKYKEKYPTERIPEYLTEDFILARALAVMAREIQELKIRCK
jgi:hypothetical protein